ncbi:MAG TPA: cytochrome c [Gaiellaceae bacterium]|nr:cytochrome c [Gaiellaceae bacterium]
MKRLRLLVTVFPAALLLAACGGGDGEERRAAGGKGDAAAGGLVYADAGCGDCHTLSAAGSTGKTGPNLDDAKPDFDRVVHQVTNGGGQMPSFSGKLSRDEIANVAAFVAEATGHHTDAKPLAVTFKPDDTKVSQCKGDSACYEQAFGNLTYEAGPKKALAVFEREIGSPGPIEGNCHRIAHTMGAAALARYDGDVGKAFVQGTAACWSGYYHGVLERAFLGVPDDELGPAAQKMCEGSDIRRVTFIAYQCVHGLGHGLMIYTGYDMPASLRVCDELATSWDQTSCTGGVFMENISSSYGVKSRWLKDDDLIYPCNTVAERHKYYCYVMVTSRILPAVGYDWKRTADLCRDSETDWIATCFQSLGRDASGNTRQNPREIAKICRVAGDMERECVYGAARDMSSNYAGGKEAAQLCTTVGRAIRSYCFHGIGTILGTLHPALSERRAACRALTTDYRAACIRGAGA